MSDLSKQLNEALDSSLQTNLAMGKKLQQQQALIEKMVGALRDIKDKGTFDNKTTGGYGRGRNYYAIMASKALQAAKEAGYE